jgi:hypothetical protein
LRIGGIAEGPFTEAKITNLPICDSVKIEPVSEVDNVAAQSTAVAAVA